MGCDDFCSEIIKDLEALDKAIENNPDMFDIYIPYEKELKELEQLEKDLNIN